MKLKQYQQCESISDLISVTELIQLENKLEKSFIKCTTDVQK